MRAAILALGVLSLASVAQAQPRPTVVMATGILQLPAPPCGTVEAKGWNRCVKWTTPAPTPDEAAAVAVAAAEEAGGDQITFDVSHARMGVIVTTLGNAVARCAWGVVDGQLLAGVKSRAAVEATALARCSYPLISAGMSKANAHAFVRYEVRCELARREGAR